MPPRGDMLPRLKAGVLPQPPAQKFRAFRAMPTPITGAKRYA
jgi:hypothetical protein